MNRIIVMFCVLMLLTAAPAMAYDQAAVDSLHHGGQNLQGADFSGYQFDFTDVLTFTSVDFTGADFSGSNLQSRTFDSCNFTGVNFQNAYIHGMRFSLCNLQGADFTNATLSYLLVHGCDLKGVSLGGLTLISPQFTNTDLSGVINGATLNSGSYFGLNMLEINWQSVTLNGPTFKEVTIEDSNAQYIQSQNVTLLNVKWLAEQSDSTEPIYPAAIKEKIGVKVIKPTTPKGAEKVVKPIKK